MTEIDTFADAMGVGDVVDKMTGFVKKLGKNPASARFLEFLKGVGASGPPSVDQFKQLIEGLPSLLGDLSKGVLGTFLTGLGDSPIVGKRSGGARCGSCRRVRRVEPRGSGSTRDRASRFRTEAGN